MDDPHAPLWETIRYDVARYPLPDLVAQALGVDDLAALGCDHVLPLLERGTDQSTPYHRAFYDAFDAVVRPTYEALVHEVVGPRIGEEFCFQTTPTYRVHLERNVAVGEFHRDGDYHHPDGELNYWLPLTRAWGTNSVWIESAVAGEFVPVEAGPGDLVHFDAVHRLHGNVPNTTGTTRVSVDFRCIPMSRYADVGAASVSAGVPLRIGGYYTLGHRPG